MAKKKVIVDYKNVPDEVLQMLADKYPHGYNKGVIKFQNAKGETVSAVPIETEEVSFLVKVSTQLQSLVDNIDVDEFDDLGLDIVGAGGGKANFADDEFDDDEEDAGFGNDKEESLDDNMDEAENIADDSDY
ncbi:MAG TPA: hypothetical protein VLZ75_13285 [Chitinophagales bacterium]|nr:hypothetical protein [Chitinophagales bacterium]